MEKKNHRIDQQIVDKVIFDLGNSNSGNYEIYVKGIWKIASARFPEKQDEITQYVINNISRSSTTVMNSERDRNTDFYSATNPASLFTFIVGGNIVSRGVTFENLLSMYFTRNVKSKLQQDTYIQRARMFGSRGKILPHFELTIPEQLYLDWHRCFVFHKLSLAAIKEGRGFPVWLANNRVSAVAGSSIDRTTVSMDKGEMAFSLFDYDANVDQIAQTDTSVFKRLNMLQEFLGEECFLQFLIDYIRQTCPFSEESIALHQSATIGKYREVEGVDKENVQKRRGFMGRSQLQLKKFPKAIHHLQIFHNDMKRARLIYKFSGSIQFIQNLRPLQA